METQARPPQALRSLLARFLAAVRHHSTHVSATAQLRLLDTFDTSQIQSAFPSYGKCRIVEIGKAPQPIHKTGRPKRLWQYSNRSYPSYGTGSTGRTFRYKKAFFSYAESATARVRPSPWPKLSPIASLPRTPIHSPGFPWQNPPKGPRPKCHSVTFLQLRKCHTCLKCVTPVTSPDTKKHVTLFRIWPARKMSQMSQFSATKTRF